MKGNQNGIVPVAIVIPLFFSSGASSGALSISSNAIALAFPSSESTYVEIHVDVVIYIHYPITSTRTEKNLLRNINAQSLKHLNSGDSTLMDNIL